MIPAAAVEAAAEAYASGETGGEIWDHPDHEAEARLRAQAILEAAAPHMLADAWDEGAIAGWKQSGEGFNAEYPDESTGGCSVSLDGNPFRPSK